MKYRTGTLHNQKHGIWFNHSISLACPLCPQLDSALHIISGCQHTQIRNMITERHDFACSMIFKAISKTGSLGSCFVCMDIDSSKRLAMPNLEIPDTAETRIIPSGSFHPAFRFTSSRLDAVLVAPISAKTKKQQTSNEGVGFLEWQGATEGDQEHLNSTASH